jgi:hypothetical protein
MSDGVLQNQRAAWMTEIITRTGGLGEDVLTATGLPATISPGISSADGRVRSRKIRSEYDAVVQ